MAWHLGGMSFGEYLALTLFERRALHEALNDMIERYNHAGAPGPQDR